MLSERKRALVGIKIDRHKIARLDLLRCDQVRQRVNEETFDGTLQVTSTVFEVDSFVQQELFCRIGAFENELRSGRFRDPVLYRGKLDVEDPPQMMFLQAAEHDDLVDAVHELRRELSFRRLKRRAIYLSID